MDGGEIQVRSNLVKVSFAESGVCGSRASLIFPQVFPTSQVRLHLLLSCLCAFALDEANLSGLMILGGRIVSSSEASWVFCSATRQSDTQDTIGQFHLVHHLHYPLK